MLKAQHILPDAPPNAVVATPDDTPGVWRDVGLSAYEYRLITELLGREPNPLELELFGVMWSEPCSYKSSQALLRRLPTSGERVVQGPGENAGAIRVGEHTVVFKIESHNSPSAVVPFDGAATGVGGVLRDIFTMGAAPVAVLDSLRFGPPEEARQRHLLERTSAGIADYAAGMGVRSAASEVRFGASYQHNPLVNAMAIGVTRGQLYQGVASGPGNRLLVFGRPTGRDGVRSASFSSKALPGDEGSMPLVPAGDPAIGRRVMEATLALLEQGNIVGMQDMGAAGFTSTTCEMAAKSGTGVVVNVAQVHTVDDSIQPFEVMLSETQERMLAVVRAGQEPAVAAILESHGVPYSFCGEVTDDGLVRVVNGEEELATVPANYLAGEAPLYVWPIAAEERAERGTVRAPETSTQHDWNEALRSLLLSPDFADASGLRRRYGEDEPGIPRAGVVDLGGAGDETAIAVCVYGNGRLVALDPYVGTQACVAVAARRVAATGAEPAAITNGLNFGSPERPQVYRQLERSITGMADACRALGTPVTGGNVSLFNEKGGQGIAPTPMIGMVGVLRSAAAALPQGFQQAGNAVVLLGRTEPTMIGSTYEASTAPGNAGPTALPAIDLGAERRLHELVHGLAAQGLLRAAHAVADGGLAPALTQMALAAAPGAAGCRATLEELPVAAALFGESHGRMLLECAPDAVSALLAAAQAAGVPATALGTVTSHSLELATAGGEKVVSLNTADLEVEWKEASPFRWEN